MTSDKKKILLIGGAALAAYFLFFNKSGEAAGGNIPIYEDQETETPSPFIEVGGYATPLQSQLAIQNRNYLIQWAGSNTTLINAFNKMNDQEINASYEYMWSYVLKGLKLYQYPGATGIYLDGGWNTALYNQIAAIRAKYHIF